MSLKRLPPPTIVLGLLCLMYLITYVNRQNLATAGADISRDLHLSKSQLGQVLGDVRRSPTRSSRFSAAGLATSGAPGARCSSAG